MRKLKNLIYEIDSEAFVFANTIKEASGGIIKSRVKKKEKNIIFNEEASDWQYQLSRKHESFKR